MDRRHFLHALTTTAALGALPTHAFANSANSTTKPAQKLLVLVYLKGGNDTYNTFVPFTDKTYKKIRPTLALAREGLIHVTDSHGFHPALKPMMTAWDSKDLALVQSIGQADITNQHYRDLERQFTAAGPDEYLDDGWLTRALAKNASRFSAPSLDAIAFDDLDIRVADPMGPFRGQKLRVAHMQHASEWLAGRRISGTKHLLTAPAKSAEQSFTLREPAALKTSFPNEPFGAALKATVEMAAAGIAPPVVHICLNGLDGDQHSGFDTHWDQLKYHGAILERLARGFAAFREGMMEIGQWNDTLFVTYDEFGRSGNENEKHGTHHGWASTQWVAGGRVKGGLHGESVPVVNVFSIDGPPPAIDYRSLYTTIIENFWGGSASGIFERRFKPIDLLRA
jgi:uncharacterized protein (DUF1501 family)